MKTFEREDGTILVGETAHENWELMAGARQGDLWFHVRNIASAHVLLRPHAAKVERRLLVECAVLAKQHSKARSAKRCKVVFAPMKNVKRGSKVGEAIVTGGKELVV